MPDSPTSPLPKLPILAFGLGGLAVSWFFFGMWFAEHGLDFGRFWTVALYSGESAGLVWDLVASGALVSVIALYRRATLGAGRVAAVLVTTFVLGVCGGLALLLLFERPTQTQP